MPWPARKVPRTRCGVVAEVGVDGDVDPVGVGGVGQVQGVGVDPPRLGVLAVGVAAAQHEDVGDDVGAGYPREGLGGQPHGSEQVGAGGDGAPGPGVEVVEGVAAGQHNGVAAGGGQVEGFDDEVVVDGEPVGVVGGVVDGELAERHVAQHGGEAGAGYAGGFESFAADLGGRVERGGDFGGDGVVFDADHDGALGGQSDEGA